MLLSIYLEVICGGWEFWYYVYNIRIIKLIDNIGEIWFCVCIFSVNEFCGFIFDWKYLYLFGCELR